MFGWSIVWWIKRFACSVFGWFNVWLIQFLSDSLAGWQFVWLIQCLVDPMFGWSNVWLVDFLVFFFLIVYGPWVTVPKAGPFIRHCIHLLYFPALGNNHKTVWVDGIAKGLEPPLLARTGVTCLPVTAADKYNMHKHFLSNKTSMICNHRSGKGSRCTPRCISSLHYHSIISS